jgi:hypothetical protein
MAVSGDWLEDRERQLARTLRTVQDYYRVSNVKLGLASGIPTSTVRNKVLGLTPLLTAESERFAEALGVPFEVLTMAPADALRWVIDHPEAGPPGTGAKGAELSSAA